VSMPVPLQRPCFHGLQGFVWRGIVRPTLDSSRLVSPWGLRRPGVAHGEAPDDQSADHIWQLCEKTGLAPGADLGPSCAPTSRRRVLEPIKYACDSLGRCDWDNDGKPLPGEGDKR
jgi:hypothetical protein